VLARSLCPVRILSAALLGAALLLSGILPACTRCERERPVPKAQVEEEAAPAGAVNATPPAPLAVNATVPSPAANATSARAENATAANATAAEVCEVKPSELVAENLRPVPPSPKAPPRKAPAPARKPLAAGNVEESFAAFAREWVEHVESNFRYNASSVQVEPADGGYVARYFAVESDSLEMRVKATTTPDCPYVGVLRYVERQLEAGGSTPEFARRGPFRPVRRVQITELFRYSGTRWVR